VNEVVEPTFGANRVVDRSDPLERVESDPGGIRSDPKAPAPLRRSELVSNRPDGLSERVEHHPPALAQRATGERDQQRALAHAGLPEDREVTALMGFEGRTRDDPIRGSPERQYLAAVVL
jgi:hypothetical protein